MTTRPSHRLAQIGSELIAHRKQLGMTRVELARAAGVSESSVARLERSHEVRVSTYLAIEDYFRTRDGLAGLAKRVARLSESDQARVLNLLRRLEEGND